MERDIEKFFCSEVKRKNGWAIKMWNVSLFGLPDRLVVKGGRAWFVELKTEKGVVSQKQKNMAKRLSSCGFPVTYIRSREDVVKFTNEI